MIRVAHLAMNLTCWLVVAQIRLWWSGRRKQADPTSRLGWPSAIGRLVSRAGAPAVSPLMLCNLSSAHININGEHLTRFAVPQYVHHPVSRSRARYDFDDRATRNGDSPAPALIHGDSKGGAFKFELLASQHEVDFAKGTGSKKTRGFPRKARILLSVVKTYKSETHAVVRRFITDQLSFERCIYSLDGSLARFMLRMKSDQLEELRAVMLDNNEQVMTELSKRGKVADC